MCVDGEYVRVGWSEWCEWCEVDVMWERIGTPSPQWRSQTSESTHSEEKLTEMTGVGLVLDAGSYLDVNGPLAQMAKSQP
jgi:hypothetical protein